MFIKSAEKLDIEIARFNLQWGKLQPDLYQDPNLSIIDRIFEHLGTEIPVLFTISALHEGASRYNEYRKQLANKVNQNYYDPNIYYQSPSSIPSSIPDEDYMDKYEDFLLYLKKTMQQIKYKERTIYLANRE